MDKNDDKGRINRRKLLQALSLGGIGASLLAYQNCSNVGFGSAMEASLGSQSVDPDDPTSPTNPNPSCQRPLNIYDLPARVPAAGPALATFDGLPVAAASGEHALNAKFYSARHYDLSAGNAQKTQYLLTVDIGLNPAAGNYHPVASSNFANLNLLSDVYVYRKDNAQLLYWKRFGGHDQIPSAMILLDEALVTDGAKLLVVARCLQHGFFSQLVDLAASPLNYATAVPAFQAGTPFGGTTAHRPYISLSATGGQNDIGVAHAPHFHMISNTQVQCTLGPVNARHGRGGPDHYIAAGLLFDQNGNILASEAEQMYAQALNHNLVFNNLDLAGRGVRALRAVLFDTYNGIMQGFLKL